MKVSKFLGISSRDYLIYFWHLLFVGYYYLMSPWFLNLLEYGGNTFETLIFFTILIGEAWAVGHFASRTDRPPATNHFNLKRFFLLFTIITIRISLGVTAVMVILTVLFTVSPEKIIIWSLILVSIKEIISVYRIVRPRTVVLTGKRVYFAEFIILNYAVLFLVGLEKLFFDDFGGEHNDAIPAFLFYFIFLLLYSLFYSAVNFVHIYPPWKDATNNWQRINVILSVLLASLLILYKMMTF